MSEGVSISMAIRDLLAQCQNNEIIVLVRDVWIICRILPAEASTILSKRIEPHTFASYISNHRQDYIPTSLRNHYLGFHSPPSTIYSVVEGTMSFAV